METYIYVFVVEILLKSHEVVFWEGDKAEKEFMLRTARHVVGIELRMDSEWKGDTSCHEASQYLKRGQIERQIHRFCHFLFYSDVYNATYYSLIGETCHALSYWLENTLCI